MGTGYVRQSAADIVPGAVVQATPINAEFNALRDSMSGTIGHAHDGTTGNGPKIDLTSSVSGLLPVAYGGINAIHKLDATTAPTINEDSDDDYGPGSIWIDLTNDKAYINVDATVGAAVWIYVGSATGAWQPLDADLTALAGLTSAADKVPYFTGSGTAAVTTLTSFARTLLDDTTAASVLTTLGISAFAQTILDDASASAARTTLGAQAQDGDLDALAALSGTNTIYYRSAANTWTAVTIGGNLTFASGVLDGVASALDATLDAIASVVTAADKAIYFTGVDVAAAYDLTAFARTLLDDADAATMRSTLGLAIGTNVLAYEAGLQSIAGLATASNKGIYFTGTDAAATFDLTAFARTILDDADAASVLTTLGAAPLASPTFTGVPAAPTAAASTNTTQIATTAFVQQELAAAAVDVTGINDLWLPAGAFVPRITNGPSGGVVELATNDIALTTLDFSASTSEGAQTFVALPKRWDGGTVTFEPYWTAASGSGTVIFALAGTAFSNDDAMDAAFGTSQSSSDTLITANDLHIGPTSSAITIAGTPANADMLILQVTRDISDTLAVDAKLIGIMLHYTVSAGTDD